MSVTTPELLAPVRPHHRLRDVTAVPELVLLPVPVSEPPYDDERSDGEGPHLALVTTQPEPVGPLAALPVLRLVRPHAAPQPVTDPSARAVRTLAVALVQGLLEALGGVRPVTQLRRRTSLELYTDLEELVQAQPRPAGVRPPTGAVLSVHVQRPTATVAEVCATVRRGARAGAIALRLELTDGAWCCTALSGLGPDLPRPGRQADDEDG